MVLSLITDLLFEARAAAQALIELTTGPHIRLGVTGLSRAGKTIFITALIEHLKQQPAAYVIHVTSRTAFVPLAVTAAYSTTRAALHSFSLSQRYLLRDTSVRVLELAPLYVQTDLMGPEQVADPRAMPLQEFIDETDAHEVLTERVAFLRNGAGPNDAEATKQVNDWFASGAH